MTDKEAEFGRLLDAVVRQIAVELRPLQIAQLYRHYELLQHWNQRINLTAIRRTEDFVYRHLGDSLLVAKIIGPGEGAVVDIGSGAGFPGVPVAVSWPDRKVVLVESVAKKATFLKEVARGMRNLQVFPGRFEELIGHFEWGVLRAVPALGLRNQLVRCVGNVALVLSATMTAATTELLGLSGVQTYVPPWDSKTNIVAGTLSSLVPRETETK